ncbi:hypothetical protein BBJ28_00021789 [Nothophytophthora sp. Chile5]|nr:hypothetical protein BBJ28_00021789 [Nothophytophthora sp. Chile5]
MIACPAYQAAQKEACRCETAATVGSANRNRLVHFLTENGAPEKELEDAAVDALLAKYEGQEPTMFLRLLKKYPAALQADPKKTNFMDDILKHGGADEPPASKRKTKRKARAAEEKPVDEHIEL